MSKMTTCTQDPTWCEGIARLAMEFAGCRDGASSTCELQEESDTLAQG